MLDEEHIEVVRDHRAWKKSQENRRLAIVITVYGLVSAAGLVTVLLTTNSNSNLFVLCVGFVVVATYLIKIYGDSKREAFFDERLIKKSESLSQEEAVLLEEKELRLGKLWRLTEKRLNLYHGIATQQAQASFRNAQAAIACGFLVIVAGAAAAFFAKTSTITIVIGALGVTGAALSAYIGKTFLRLQENASSHLRSYFEQPQDQFRYLAAERLLINFPQEASPKADAIGQIIHGLVAFRNRGNDS